MQQDKFERAEACIDETNSENPSSSSPVVSPIVSPDKRRGSAEYWKAKYEQAMSIIDERREESINIEEIPGVMTIQKVKPKTSKKSTRVTQVHGSMKGRDILATLRDIHDKKEQEKLAKEEAVQNKEEAKQAFYLCKTKCVCGEAICKALEMKECSICHNVIKSACSKASCKIDGAKPKMILPAAAASSVKIKRKNAVKSSKEESEESSSDVSDSDDNITESEEEENEDREAARAIQSLQATWNFLKPPTAEDEIEGKWFGVMYGTKRSLLLLVGKVLKRFLEDENGPVESLEIRCLKPKTGSGTVLEDTPESLPDIGLFDLHDVILGPLEVIAVKGNKFEVPLYSTLVDHFHIVKKMKREDLI